MRVFILIIISFFSLNTVLGQQAKKMSLQMCISLALENNLSMKEQDLAKKQLAINYQQNRMNRWPSINASANHNYNFGRTIDPITNSFVNQTIQSNNFSLNAGVTIYNGFALKNRIIWSQNEIDRNGYVGQVLKNNLALSVTDAYIQIVYAEQELSNAELQKNSTIAQLARVKKLVNAGSINQGQQLNLEAQKANDKLQVQIAKSRINSAYLILTSLMQYPINEDYRIEIGDIPNPFSASYTDKKEVLERCLVELPEIKNSKKQVESSLINEEITKAGFQPKLSLYANANTLYSESRLEKYNIQPATIPIGFTGSNETVFSNITTFDTRTTGFGNQLTDNFGQSVGLSLSIPIFNNNRVKNNLEQAKLNTELANVNLEKVKSQTRSDVLQAFLDYENARATYIASNEMMQAQEANYNFTKKRFEAGLITSVELLLAKNNWQNAQTNFNRSKYQLIFTKTQVEFYRSGAIKI